MQACCPSCGDQYLDSDGEPIPHLLRDARLKRLARLKQVKQGQIPKWLHEAEIKYLSQPFTEDSNFCRCDCHVVGSNVVH